MCSVNKIVKIASLQNMLKVHNASCINTNLKKPNNQWK